MKGKSLNALLILTSLFGFLEWGQNNKAFLFEAEAEIISKLFSEPLSVIHPLTLLPFLGQILLLVTLFQKIPGMKITFIGIFCLGILILLMFVIGCISLNFKILLSTLPFLVVAYFTVKHHLRLLKNVSINNQHHE